jgi:hypothetical protein
MKQLAVSQHILIVRPDTTEEEILETTSEGADTRIFQQALMNSDRRGQARGALKNVRQRHTAIQQIEKTMIELQQLFQDLDAIILEQEPGMHNVEQKALDTNENLEQGNVQIDRAIKSAKAARKRKWICLWISIAMVLLIVIIILIWASVTSETTSRFYGHVTVICSAKNFYRALAMVEIVLAMIILGDLKSKTCFLAKHSAELNHRCVPGAPEGCYPKTPVEHQQDHAIGGHLERSK